MIAIARGPVVMTGLLALLLLVGACGGPQRRAAPQPLPDSFVMPPGSASQGLHLEGVAKGPVLGAGPRLDVEIWLRSDAWLRADLQYDGDDGAPIHETLIWTPQSAVLFDRRRGRFAEMGDEPGWLEMAGGTFRVPHLVWLATGRWLSGQADLEGAADGPEWRGRSAELGLRCQEAARGDRLAWAELVWRDDEGRIHQLRADHGSHKDTAWGAIPSNLSLEGTELSVRAVVDWKVTTIESPGDSIFDPLWKP